MARTGIARLRHQRHRAYGRMRKQKVAPRYLGEQSTRLSGSGQPSFQANFTAANATNQLNFAAAHGLATGDGPFQLSNAGGALPAGLAASTDYWVSVVDPDSVQLLDAPAGAVVTFTDDGTGTHTMTSFALNGPDKYPVEAVGIPGDTLQITGHPFITGDGPYEVESDGSLPGGLAAGEQYYIKVSTPNVIQLVTDKRRAKSVTPVDITSAGAGNIVLKRHVASAGAVLSWHDSRRSERVAGVADVDDL